MWPIFGTCNQLMASIGLRVATSYIIRRGRPLHGLVTFWPVLVFASASIHGAAVKVACELLPLETTAAYVQAAILLLFIALFMATLTGASRMYVKIARAHLNRKREQPSS